MIYFALRGPKTVKIGCSMNPQHRAWSLGCVTLIWEGPGSFKDERRMHKRYAEYRSHGEWFNVEGRLKARVDAILASDKYWKLRFRCLSPVMKDKRGPWKRMKEQSLGTWNA